VHSKEDPNSLRTNIPKQHPTNNPQKINPYNPCKPHINDPSKPAQQDLTTHNPNKASPTRDTAYNPKEP
jgi:hypothetical protein